MTATSQHIDSCIFCKIVNKTIPSRAVYEDDDVYAFHDISPAAPIHFLVIPKAHITSMFDVSGQHEGLMGRIMSLIPQLALEQGCDPYPDGGFRVVCNNGQAGGQEVQHLHFHVMGGPRPWGGN